MMPIIMQARGVIKNSAYRSVGLYIFTNFFSKGVSLILIPIFTDPKFLTPTDNGVLSLFSSNMILLAPFICLGMIQSSTADFYKKSKPEFANLFTTQFVIGGFMTLLATGVLYLFKDYLKVKFDFPESFVIIIPVLVFLVFSSEQLVALIRNRNEVHRFAFVGISKSIIEYSLSVVLIVYFYYGWKGRVWGIAGSLIAVNLFGLYYYAKNGYLHYKIRRTQVWDELKFGMPVFLFQLCVFMLGSSNKLFLAIFNVNKYDLGIYAIACIMGSMIGTLSQSILLYVQPQLYKSISSGEATLKSVKSDFIRYWKMLTIVSVICMAIAIFAYYFLINKIYLSGIRYFFLVSLQTYIWGLNYFLFLFLLYHKAKRKIFAVSLISIVCSVAINIYMVKNFLILGDALSSLINTLIFSILVIIFVQKIIKTTLHKTAKPVSL